MLFLGVVERSGRKNIDYEWVDREQGPGGSLDIQELVDIDNDIAILGKEGTTLCLLILKTCRHKVLHLYLMREGLYF